MLLSINAQLSYTSAAPASILLQIEAAQGAHQSVEQQELSLPGVSDQHAIVGQDDVGTRQWIRSSEVFTCDYSALVRVNREDTAMDALTKVPLVELPASPTRYLMPSRYCHPETFIDVVFEQFGHLSGGHMISAMCHWINDTFTYDNGASHAGTTATDTLASRAGVCRDYAHVLIAMARAAGIPARFASVYAPDVTPQDFHAVVEVFLSGRWQLIDPTGMARPSEMVLIGTGSDAAEVSFMTSYGWMTLKNQTVEVKRIG